MKRTFVAAGTGLTALIAAQFVGQPSEAQLKPWDHSNEVLVDLSVLEDSGTGPSVDTSSRVFLPGLGERLLTPPRRMPISRLLAPRPPMEGGRLKSQLPTVKLVPPSELRKRRATAKRKPSRKAPVRMASKPARKLTPLARPSAKMAKRTQAPAPPAKPRSKVTTGKAPLPPVPSSRPPAAPSLAKAAPPKPRAPAPGKVAGKTTGKATPNSMQQASRLPEPAGPQTANVVFATGASALTPAAQKNLAAILARMKGNAAMRLQLMAYAGEAKLSPSKARRLSLSRALAVRSYLIKQGVRSTRIDVRALGNKVPPGAPSRVDLRVLEN